MQKPGPGPNAEKSLDMDTVSWKLPSKSPSKMICQEGVGGGVMASCRVVMKSHKHARPPGDEVAGLPNGDG